MWYTYCREPSRAVRGTPRRRRIRFCPDTQSYDIMNAKRLIPVLALAAAFVCAPAASAASAPYPDLGKDPANLPVCFDYRGAGYHGFPAEWNPTTETVRVSGKIERTGITATLPDGILRARFELDRYLDHNVCEWILWMENISADKDSDPILRMCASDVFIPRPGKKSPLLWHGIGENHEGKNYAFERVAIPEGQGRWYNPNGGRACDNAFPYFRVLDEKGGAFFAIGWPGQWFAEVSNRGGQIFVRCGQNDSDFYLRPGEKARTPRFTVLSFEGPEQDGVNRWRDWYRDHILPRPGKDGKHIQPMLCGAIQTPPVNEFCYETISNQLYGVQFATDNGYPIDAWWIDAGWYSNCHRGENGQEVTWVNTGCWRPDEKRFPDGFRPLSEKLAKHNARLLVWFEPERVARDEDISWPLKYLIDPPNNPNRMYDLSNPEAVEYISGFMIRFLRENGIAIYRQDFNFPPYWHWEYNDARQGPHRRGATENFYCQGYLRYWDNLLAGVPGLIIDSCASGGRRNDLETMRRAVPLHYSDYGYTVWHEKPRYHHVLQEWGMYRKDNAIYARYWNLDASKKPTVDRYQALVGFAPFMCWPFSFPAGQKYDLKEDFRFIDIWREASSYMLDGDYYLLSPESFLPYDWAAMQYHGKEGTRGYIVVTRNVDCPLETLSFTPHGIDPDADYEILDMFSGGQQRIPGKTIVEKGLSCAVPAANGTVLRYTKIRE